MRLESITKRKIVLTFKLKAMPQDEQEYFVDSIYNDYNNDQEPMELGSSSNQEDEYSADFF